jgi:ribosomal protein L11 methyltransferase
MSDRYTVQVAADERDLVLAALWNAGALGIWEREAEIVAWFPEATSAVPPGGQWEREPERDWLADWKAGLNPITVGGITIVPTWLADDEELSKAETVVLDPGMAFGTGHHATTRLCLRAMQRIGVEQRSVLDVGTGSGILAIAAAKLGAQTVTAIDTDPEAVAVARENAEVNGVAIEVLTGSLDAVAASRSFAIVVANIVTPEILHLAAELLAVTAEHLIVSGISAGRSADVRRALTDLGAQVVDDLREDEWAAITCRV